MLSVSSSESGMNHQRLRGMDAYILSIVGNRIDPTVYLYFWDRGTFSFIFKYLSLHFSLFFLSALVSCGDPGSPSNGHKRGWRYWTGESVSFLCDPQYHLTGPATRMCLPSGKWIGIQPSCKYLLNCVHHDTILFSCQPYQKTRFHIAW